eukprot:4365184-Amphidinium_carterae.1
MKASSIVSGGGGGGGQPEADDPPGEREVYVVLEEDDGRGLEPFLEEQELLPQPHQERPERRDLRVRIEDDTDRYCTRRNAHNLRYSSLQLAKMTHGETTEDEQKDSRTWSRKDKGVQKFVGSGVGGPVWDTVWKRLPYNEDAGELLSDELTKSITKKDLY